MTEERMEKLREYKRNWQRQKRATMKGLDVSPFYTTKVMTNKGNEQYRALCREEREWLKKADFCVVCKQMHPPMKSL